MGTGSIGARLGEGLTLLDQIVKVVWIRKFECVASVHCSVSSYINGYILMPYSNFLISLSLSPVSEINEFEPLLISAKNRFQLSAGSGTS